MKDNPQASNLNEPDPTQPVADQAAWWWLVLNEPGCTPAEQQVFTEWLAKSPERVEAYMRVTLLKRTLDVDTRWPSDPADHLIQAARESRAEVIHLPTADLVKTPTSEVGGPLDAVCTDTGPHAPLNTVRGRDLLRAAPAKSNARMRLFAVAATLLVTIAAVWYVAIGSNRYSTEFGEQRSILLSDGSVVTLNTASVIDVDFAQQHRTIRLRQGEALLRVAHDAGRPFEVIAGETTIRAVGTQFNVDRRRHRTTVTVIDGSVLVAQAPVAVGEQARTAPLATGEQIVVAAGKIEAPKPVNVLAATAWTKRRLVFERRPLSEVAEEFNRYNRDRIVIEDPALRRQEVTGDFDADRVESFLTFLAGTPGVRVVRDERGAHVVTAVTPE